MRKLIMASVIFAMVAASRASAQSAFSALLLLETSRGKAEASSLVGRWVQSNDFWSVIEVAKKGDTYTITESYHGKPVEKWTSSYRNGKWIGTDDLQRDTGAMKSTRWETRTSSASEASCSRDLYDNMTRSWGQNAEFSVSVSRSKGQYSIRYQDPTFRRLEMATYGGGRLALGSDRKGSTVTYRRAKPGEKPSKTDLIRWSEKQSCGRMYKLYDACMSYVHDHSDTLPSFDSADSLRAALKRYVQDPSIFTNPLTGRPYVANEGLGGRKWGGTLYSNCSRIVLFYEDSPSPLGTRGIQFLSMEGGRWPESEWAGIRGRSQEATAAATR